MQEMVGVLHYMKPSGCVSSACRAPNGAIPPIGGGEDASQPCVVPTVQTASTKNADNGLLWARWSAFWALWCLGWCVCMLSSWRLGAESTSGAGVATRCQSGSGVPAKARREQHAVRPPTVMADDDQKQVQAPPRATHTDCG